MIRLGRQLILNKLNNVNVDYMLKYYNELISDGIEPYGISIPYKFNNDCDINIPRYIYILEDGSIHTYELESIMYDEDNGTGSASTHYDKAGVYYKGNLVEKENLFNMVYGNDNGDGLTKEQIQELISSLEKNTYYVGW